MLGSYLIKPDQMQIVNPLLILALIPIFDQLIYPWFAKYVEIIESYTPKLFTYYKPNWYKLINV